MKTLKIENITIEIETYDRFENKVRAYKEENGSILFLGKYIIGTRECDLVDLIKELTK